MSGRVISHSQSYLHKTQLGLECVLVFYNFVLQIVDEG
jgi:hypothetical protein